MVVVWYSFYRFRARVTLLQEAASGGGGGGKGNRKGQGPRAVSEFGDHRGPAALTLLLVFVLSLNALGLGRLALFKAEGGKGGGAEVEVVDSSGSDEGEVPLEIPRGFAMEWPLRETNSLDPVSFFRSPFPSGFQLMAANPDIPLVANPQCDYSLDLPSFYEASGVAYDRVDRALYVQNDEGSLSKIDLASKLALGVWKISLKRLDTEDITIAQHGSGIVFLAEEDTGRILEFDTKSVPPRRRRTWTLPGLPFKSGGAGQGLEALAFVPTAASPHGGFFYTGQPPFSFPCLLKHQTMNASPLPPVCTHRRQARRRTGASMSMKWHCPTPWRGPTLRG